MADPLFYRIRSIAIEALLAACQQDAFPEAFAGKDQLVWNPKGSVLKQSETKIAATVREAGIAHEVSRLDVASVAASHIGAPTGPNALIAIGRPNRHSVVPSRCR